MNEAFPQNPGSEDTPEKSAEQIPKTYAEVLLEARALHEQGVVPRYNLRDPELAKFWDSVEDWYGSLGIPADGIETPDQAANAIRESRLLVDAGYLDEESITEAQDALFVELDLAKAKSGNDEAVAAIDTAIAALDALLAMKYPEREILSLIDAKVEAARAQAESEVFVEASRILTGDVLLFSRNKKFFEKNPAKKAEITALRDEYTRAWHQQRAAKKKAEEL